MPLHCYSLLETIYHRSRPGGALVIPNDCYVYDLLGPVGSLIDCETILRGR